MCLGTLLLVSALILFLLNYFEAKRAQTASEEILDEIIQRIEENTVDSTPLTDESIPDPFDYTMDEVEIDGYSYIGYLSIPSLSLELPVMADLDMSRLKVAPCRYCGSVKSDDLVIAAHNYARHFGGLQNLKSGDTVWFTDMNGIVTSYQVYELEILPPTAIEEMVVSDAALTLFTCTYGGKTRVTVRCMRTSI